jgi:uncharacterized protein
MDFTGSDHLEGSGYLLSAATPVFRRLNMSSGQLIEAIRAENISAVKDLISTAGDINQQDEQGWTPLNWAAGKGNLELVKLLVNNGADISKVGRDQRTPYMIALAAGHAEVAKLLRQMEDLRGNEQPSRSGRQYCKAYYLKDLRRYPNWVESKINWKEQGDRSRSDKREDDNRELTDDDIVFLHSDYSVTQSMWHSENVIFNQTTSEWKEFCASSLNFNVPGDLDLIVSAR